MKSHVRYTLFQVGAGAFIGVGSYLASDMPSSDYSAIFDEDFDTEVWETSVYVTITLGCVIIFVGVAGFCGVWRESTFLLFLVRKYTTSTIFAL